MRDTQSTYVKEGLELIVIDPATLVFFSYILLDFLLHISEWYEYLWINGRSVESPSSKSNRQDRNQATLRDSESVCLSLSPRRVLTKFRVRTGGAHGNQIHSTTL